MEKSNRLIPLIYGYAVCLTAIIVTLISVSMIVGAIFTLQDPLRDASRHFFGPAYNLSSYEAYKIDVLSRNGDTTVSPKGESTTTTPYVPTEEELRASYEAQREDQIASARHQATRDITNGIILLLIAAGLFFSHWRWLNRLNG